MRLWYTCSEPAMLYLIIRGECSKPHTSELAGVQRAPHLASWLEDSRYVCMYGRYMIPYISVIYLSGALPQVWARDHARPNNALHSPSIGACIIH